MNKELQQKLFDTFPKLYAERVLPATQTCMCWGIATGDGWFKLIWDLSEKLEPLCDDVHCAKQVKSKFGTLRFYISGTDEMYLHVQEAENLSAFICEFCGERGTQTIVNYWVYTVCEKCKDEHLSTKK